jgi:hypothetical protein
MNKRGPQDGAVRHTRTRWLCCLAVVALVGLGACAVRSGPGPADPVAMALQLEQPGVEEVAGQIAAADADIALIAADRDSAWFAELAAASGLDLSGPGRTGARGIAFLTRMELVGDTSLALSVATGGAIHMHDALYRAAGRRLVDLMYVRYENVTDLREATRTLLEYVATDVGGNVALLLAIEAGDAAATDSVAVLLRVLYPSAWDCTEPGRAGEAPANLRVRLFYGPPARVRCAGARRLTGAGAPVAAQFVLRG